MATDVLTSAMNFPYSLGKILPGSTYASASVPLTQNTRPVRFDPTTEANVPETMFNGIYIQAFGGTGNSDGNSKAIFVCNSAAAPDTTNYTNVVGVLMPGDQFPRFKEWANNRDLSKLYIGAQNATDFALVVIDQF